MQSILMHVGADTSSCCTLGVCGPVFEDLTFEFLPILEIQRTRESRSYEELKSHNDGQTLARYVPIEYAYSIPHCDPDMEHFTYSEPVESIRGNLMKNFLRRGGYLFFVSSLAKYSKEAYRNTLFKEIRKSQIKNMAKHVIGYMEIKDVFIVDTAHMNGGSQWISTTNGESVNSLTVEQIRPQLEQNAHYKRLPSDSFVCAIGERDGKESALLKKALRLTEFGAPFDPNELGRSVYGNKIFQRGFKTLSSTQTTALLTGVENNDTTV